MTVLFVVAQLVILSPAESQLFTGGEAIAAPTDCSDTTTTLVTNDATDAENEIKIDCNLTLSSDDNVTKRLIFEGESATGVTVNCNGATLNGGEGPNFQNDMIHVISKEIMDPATGVLKWERPQDITIKNCNITGSIRVWGMTRVHSDPFRESSMSSEHTTRARNNAPTRIIFDNVSITATGKIPIYLSPGVTYFQLINSEIGGETNSVVIYLDSESCCNTFKNNRIHATTSERSVMAVDSSNYNRIFNNRFSGLNHGGIYLYRNCGERGAIRHATPSHNMIINNIFYYNKYKGGNPSVYLGSRNGKTRKGKYGYCGDDKGYPYGSSASDLDYSRYNVVMQNQIYKRSIDDMIISKSWPNNSPNYIGYNQTVTAETVVNNRPAGCYVEAGYGTKFIFDGETIEVLENADGEPTFGENKYTCRNGDLIPSYISKSDRTKVSFDCYVTGNNDGCNKIVHCPSGQKIVDATAACNLEYGTISDDILATVPMNNIQIMRASDKVSKGSCYVASNSLQIGRIAISGIDDSDRMSLGCKEHDQNGGDCHIKGTMHCR